MESKSPKAKKHSMRYSPKKSMHRKSTGLHASQSTVRLPPLSIEETIREKYFGEESKKAFNDTYKQLKARGDIIVGGYDMLSHFVAVPDDRNVLTKAVVELESSGVISERTNLDSYTQMHSKSTLKAPGATSRSRARLEEARNSRDNNNNNNSLSGLRPQLTIKIDKPEDAQKQGRGGSVRFPQMIAGDDDSGTFLTRLPGVQEDHGHDEMAVATTGHDMRDTPQAEAAAAAAARGVEGDAESSLDLDPSLLTEFDSANLEERGKHTLKDDYSTLGGGGDDDDTVENEQVAEVVNKQEALMRELDLDLNSLNLDSYSVTSRPPLYANESTLDTTYSVASPRAIFISGCLRNKIPPITIGLLRKKLSTTINLAHMGIGNKVGAILAECISTIPHLQYLNISDNNLDDKGLAILLNSIQHHASVKVLDISKNIVDGEAAVALGNFISTENCQLECIIMSDANVDDRECHMFVQQLKNNKHLTEIDMSCNLLGKDENLNVVQPEFVTAGESLAELFLHPDCYVKKIDLRWNMIRMEGAQCLCNSLRVNETVTDLNLSYNAIGKDGAFALGSALLENNTLRRLNVGNNNIDAISAFTMIVGVRGCKSLEYFGIDGNPIGEQGARVLAKLIITDGQRLDISCNSCDLIMSAAGEKFNSIDPYGKFELEMTNEYDRAILIEILSLVQENPTIDILTFELFEEGSKTPQAHKLLRREFKRRNLTAEELEEDRQMQILGMAPKLGMIKVKKAVTKYEEVGLSSFPTSHLQLVLKELGMIVSDLTITYMNHALDADDDGFINSNHFIEYILTRGSVAEERHHSLNHEFICCLSASPDQRYIPPQKGKIVTHIVEGYLKKLTPEQEELANTSQKWSTLSNTCCEHVLSVANDTTNPTQFLIYMLDASKLHLEEAAMMYEHLYHLTDDSVAALAKVLQHVFHPHDAKILVNSTFASDTVRLRRLRGKLGNIFNPLMGLYSGYYTIDLTNPIDRECLKRLINQSITCEYERKSKGKWDTSQLGNWSCFRNEIHSRVTDANITICPTHFYPIPRKGKVEFDFVNIIRPNPRVSIAMDDDHFLRHIAVTHLATDTQMKWMSAQLVHHDRVGRKSALSNGNPLWKPSLAMGLHIGQVMHHDFYPNLANRGKLIMEELNRREITSRANTAALNKKPKQGLFSPKSGNKPSSGTGSREALMSPKNGNKNSSSAPLTRRKSMMDSTEEKEYSIVMTALGRMSEQQHPITHGTSQLGFGYANDTIMSHPDGASLVVAVCNAFGSGDASSVVSDVSVGGDRGGSIVPAAVQGTKRAMTWTRRLKHLMSDERIGPDTKSAGLMEYFYMAFTDQWFYCKHLSVLLAALEYLVHDTMNMAIFGTFRVEIVILLFDRLLDLHNFELIHMVLSAHENAALTCRLGILNIFNPCKPEGYRQFELSKYDERQVVKMLVLLSVAEEGENWCDERFTADLVPTPGWELNKSWFTEQGLPKKGTVSLDFFSGMGINLSGCSVKKKLRNRMTCLVLTDPRDLVVETSKLALLPEHYVSKVKSVEDFGATSFIGDRISTLMSGSFDWLSEQERIEQESAAASALSSPTAVGGGDGKKRKKKGRKSSTMVPARAGISGGGNSSEMVLPTGTVAATANNTLPSIKPELSSFSLDVMDPTALQLHAEKAEYQVKEFEGGGGLKQRIEAVQGAKNKQPQSSLAKTMFNKAASELSLALSQQPSPIEGNSPVPSARDTLSRPASGRSSASLQSRQLSGRQAGLPPTTSSQFQPQFTKLAQSAEMLHQLWYDFSKGEQHRFTVDALNEMIRAQGKINWDFSSAQAQNESWHML